MHPRLEIINHIGTLFKTLPKITRVVNSRLAPRFQSFPALTFYDEDESITALTIHDKGDTDRDINLTAIIWVRWDVDPEKTEAQLDDLSWLVEQALPFEIDVLNVYGIQPIGIVKDVPDYEEDGARLATATVSFKISYTLMNCNY